MKKRKGNIVAALCAEVAAARENAARTDALIRRCLNGDTSVERADVEAALVQAARLGAGRKAA